MSELDFDEAKLKEEIQFLRKLGKKTDYYRHSFDKEPKKLKITKKTVEELVSIQQKPYYQQYVEYGKSIVEKQNRKKEQLLSSIPIELQSIPIQDVLDYNNENKISKRDYSPFIEKIKKIIPPPEKPKLSNSKFDILPYDYEDQLQEQLEKEHPDYNYWNNDYGFKEKKNKYEQEYNQYLQDHPNEKKELEQWNEKYWEWRKNTVDKIKDVIANQYENNLCVIEPTDTIELIKKKSDCNYGKIIEYFINTLKDDVKEQIKKKEWNKKYLGGKTVQKYHQTLDSMVKSTEIQTEIQDGFIQSYKTQVSNAVSKIDYYKQKRNEIDAKKEELRKQRKYYTKDYEELDREYNSVSKTYDYMQQLLKRFYNSTTKDFNHDQIKLQAKIDTEETIESFVEKNTEKMATILYNREDCDQFNPELRFGKGIIEGDINVKCKDGEEFRVNNQLVFVPEGERIAHYRFPTTFHDVKYKAKQYKMVTEQWMNEEFSKK